MTGDVRLRPSALPRPTLQSVLGVPFRLQTYRNLLYLTLAFPLGLLYFVFLAVGLSVGVGLTIIVVGVPILLLVLAVATGFAWFERHLTRLLLGVDIPAPPSSPLASGADRSPAWRLKALVAGVGTWKAVVYLASKLVVGVASFAALTCVTGTAVSMLAVPFVYDQPDVYVGLALDGPATLHPALALRWDGLLVGLEGGLRLTSWQVTTLPEALAVAGLGAGFLLVALNALNALAWLSGRYARLMLGDVRWTDAVDADAT